MVAELNSDFHKTPLEAFRTHKMGPQIMPLTNNFTWFDNNLSNPKYGQTIQNIVVHTQYYRDLW
jgi:hypothetical protein